MAYLSRDDILTADDIPTKDVEVPEWGGTVRVRGLSGEDRDAYEMSTMAERPKLGGRAGETEMVPDLANRRAKLVARCVVSEDGGPLFTAADIVALGKKSAAALERVHDKAAELSGLTGEAEKEIEGNSAAATDGGSDSSV